VVQADPHGVVVAIRTQAYQESDPRNRGALK
jgi:hypothetical protein